MRKDISQNHKNRLRAQLLAHAEDHLTKKKPFIVRYWPVVAIPAMALAVFAVTALWQPLEKSSNPIVQQVAGPLTAQKVFAAAIKYLESQKLQPGEYYYTRTVNEHTYNDKDSADPGNNCIHTKEYQEMYINSQGIMERMTFSDGAGRLFQLSTQTPDGRNSGPKFFTDQEIAHSVETRVSCPEVKQPKVVPEPMSIEEYQSSPQYRITSDISSGDPARQRTALNILLAEPDFTVAENEHIPEYARPVIALSSDTKGDRLTYYFDQQTKAYVGLNVGERSRSIVIEQDIRKLPTNDPPEYTQPLPTQR